jgi:RNA polymerase sigma factor for flagellar operon FliA
MTLTQAWERYKRDKDDAAKEMLVTEYTPLIHFVLGQIHLPYTPLMQFEDAMSYGFIGLLDALEKFDPSRGFKFETYAVARIRGAVRDGMRETQWMPRSVLQKMSQVEKAMQRLESEQGRPPTEDETADALGLTKQAFQSLLNDISPVTLYSLEEVVFETKDGEAITLGDTLADHESPSPQESAEWEEHKRLLSEAIESLPEREKLVVALYCYEELTLKEIGEVMGISSSRVCQLYTHALIRLRSYLSAYHQEVFGSAPEVTKRRAGRRPKQSSPEEAVMHGSGHQHQPPAIAAGKDSRRGKAPTNTAKSAPSASASFKYRRGTTRPTEKSILPLAV